MKVKKLGRKALSFLLAILMILYSVPIMSYASLLSSEDDASSQYDTTELAKDAFEVIELREENVKQFRLEDGTYVAAQYEKPVHYLDENNIWQNIDNTLEDYGSEFATSNERIKFSKKITGNEVIFTLHENNRKLTLSLDGAIKKVSGTAINTKTDFDESDTKLQKLMTLDTLSSKVIYQDILDGVDLEYVVDSYDIKENIIVKKKNDSYKYTFTLKLNNLTAALNSSGDVVISDSSTDEIVYIIPAPVVYDANDVYASSNTAEYTLVAIETNTYSLSVTVDSDWMNDEDRAYPVVIDPPLSVATSQYTDLYIDESLPNSTIDSEFRLIVSSGNRAYWKASTLPNIPDSAYIYKATLSLKSAMADNGFVGAYRITSDWDSTLTWNKTTSSTPQGSFSTDVLDHNQIKPSIYNTYEDTDDVWYEWNITEAVDAWYSGTANYGIGFKNVDDTATSVTWFHSREAVSRSNMPRFAVYYKDMKGIESYWTYASQSVGFAGTGYVNYATGALTFGKSLLSTTDSLMPFTPSLVYNSSLAGKAFKYPNAQVSYWGTYEPLGFKLSIHETIIKKEYISADGNEGSMYILSDEDGTEHYFLPTIENSEPSTTVYQDDDGLQLILNTSSTQLTITDNSQTVRTYNKLSGVPSNSGILSGWYLESITDANGNKIKIDFEAGPNPCTISLVPNGSQQIDFLTIAYNSYYVPYMIWNQTTKEALIFKYSNTPTGSITATSETKYLRKIEYVRSNVALTKAEWKAYAEGSSNSSIESLASASYTYNSSGYLTKAKDELSGYEVRYTYSSGKITTIQEYVGSNAGQKFGITYHTGYTEVRSPGSDDAYGNADDIITRYVFDLEGRVTSMYSMDSGRTKIHGASSGVYEKQDNVKNNLKTTVVVGGNAANYILNGGFSDIKDSKAEHWTKTSNVSFPIESVDKDGQRHAEFNIDGISTESLKQYVRLNEGDYTLSVYVNAYDCQNTKMYLKMRSLDNTNNIYEKQVPINEFYSIENGAYASLHFSADNFNSTGYENFELSIIVKGVTSTAEATVKVDNVMLEENIGVSNYNMVQYGSFEKTSIDSSGNYLSNIVNYWENESGGLIRGLTSNVFGYTGYIEGSLTEEKYLKQTVYKADPNVLAYYDNGGSYGESEKTYLVSGFAKGTAQLPSESAPFRIRVDVSYYHGINQEIEVISEKFDFNKFCNDWQFVCGTFDTKTGVVFSIDIYLEYSYQPGGYAMFDGISVVQSSDDSVTKYAYHENGLLHVQQTGYYTEVYEYTEKKQIKRIANSRGELTDYTYEDNGIDVKHTDTYSFHRIESEDLRMYPYGVEDPDSLITKTLKVRTEYDYNNFGQMTSSLTYEAVYDSNGVIVPKTNVKQISSSYTFETTPGSRIFGAMLTETDNLGITTRYFYDESNGRLMAVLNTSASTGTCYTYDDLGNVKTVFPAVYASTSAVDYEAVTEKQNVTYEYTNNQLTGITSSTTTYNFVYDVWGNTDRVSVGNNEIVNYEYNPNNGKLIKINYANGFSVEYVYNELENIKEVWYTENNVRTLAYEYTYTSYGQMHRFDNHLSGKGIVYDYDTENRMVGYAEFDLGDMSDIYSATILYNDKSLVKAVYYDIEYSYTTGIADNEYYYRYVYNNDDTLKYAALKTLVVDGRINYTYDEYDRLESKEFAFGEYNNNIEYTFSSSGNNTSSRVETYKSTVNGTARIYTYTYDNKGNITKISVSNGDEYRYEYDDLGQLIREDNTVDNHTYMYFYDNSGNLTAKFVCGLFEEGQSVNSFQNYYGYSYTNSNWGDQLTNYNGTTITYDAIGNPLSYYNGSSYTFTWENGRQLATAVKGNYTLSFEYNNEGIRTSKTVNGIEHVYHLNGSQIVYETWGANLIVYFYDADGSPIGMQYRNTSYSEGVFDVYWFEKNLQGDIVAVYNQAGTKLISYTYDAWGNCTATYYNGGVSTTATYNPFRYRGYYFDIESGFYYLNSRYYDPVTGRFINADSLLSQGSVLGNNMFAYCLNNPVNMADTTGELPFFLITAAIGAVAGAIIGGVVAAKNGGNVWAGIGIGAAAGGLAGAGLGVATGVMLAGSATASTAAVASGAGMLATAVSTGGAGAGLALVADNISRAVNNVGTVLYSGGEQARQAATTFANNTGGTTIDPTVIGQVADGATKVPGADFTTVWSQASATFCHQARGVVNAFVSNSAYRGVDSIFWSVEMPTLLNNPRVTEIIIHIFE